jgi:drug/metabolite transporter, DME family
MLSQPTSRRDFLLIVCASISWGTVGIANQTLYASSATNALSLSFLRLAIATPLFFSRLLGPSWSHSLSHQAS